MTVQQILITELENMGFDFFDECDDGVWQITICNGKQSYTINSHMVCRHGSKATKQTQCYESALQWIIDMENK